MLNKKDPLIGAVLEVMNRNHVEREAAQAVNEYFGIEDRKALPHEYQGQWDAAYQQVLNEGVEALDEKLHGDQPKIDVAKPYGKLTKHDFKKLRSMEEENEKPSDVSSYGWAIVQKSKEMAKKKKKKLEEASIEAIQEEIAYNLAEQAAFIEENFGDEALMDFYSSLTEEQLEIVEGWMDSLAAGARGAWDSATLGGGKYIKGALDYGAKKAAYAVGMGKDTTYADEVDQERKATEKAQRENPTAYSVGDYGATAATLATGVGGLARLGAKGALKLGMKSAEKLATRQPAKGVVGKTVRAIDNADMKAMKTGVAGYGTNYGHSVATSDDPAKKLGSDVTKAAKYTGQVAKGAYRYGQDAARAVGLREESQRVGFFSKLLGKLAAKGSDAAQAKKAAETSSQALGGFGKVPKGKQVSAADAGTMAAKAKKLADAGRASKASKDLGGFGKTVDATKTLKANRASKDLGGFGKTVDATKTLKANRASKDLGGFGKTVDATKTLKAQKSAGDLGGFGKTVDATKTLKAQKSAGDLGGFGKRTAIGAGIAGGAAGYVASQVGNKPDNAAASGPATKVAMTARKIEAPGRQVSAREIMSSQQYKQGVKAVGGEAAARKIQPGTNVKGVGTIEKGSNIYRTVEKNLSKTAVPGFERGNTKGGAGR